MVVSIILRFEAGLYARSSAPSPMNALYASTHPLEALRLLLGRATTLVDGELENELMVNDVSRVMFYAKYTRILYVEINSRRLRGPSGLPGPTPLALVRNP